MQRTLLVFALLACGLQAAGQASPLPIDSTTQKITYQGVVQAPGVGADELYARAREWFAVTFNSGKAVLDMDDPVAGRLIGKGYSGFYQTALVASGYYEVWRTFKVYVRDGRARYEITDFMLAGPYKAAPTASASSTAKQLPVDSYFGEKAHHNVYYYDRKGKAKDVVQNLANKVQEATTADIAALTKTLAGPANKKKDW